MRASRAEREVRMATATTDLQRPWSAAAVPAVGWHSFRAEMDRLFGERTGGVALHNADESSRTVGRPAIDGAHAADRPGRALHAAA